MESEWEIRKTRQMAALSPLLSAAGLFIHPVACTLLPFVYYLFLRRGSRELAKTVALRTADLAFTVQIFLILVGLGLHLLALLSGNDPAGFGRWQLLLGGIIAVYFFANLIIALVLAWRGSAWRFPLSLRLAERIFAALGKRPAADPSGR
jgi:hypothetical protein